MHIKKQNSLKNFNNSKVILLLCLLFFGFVLETENAYSQTSSSEGGEYSGNKDRIRTCTPAAGLQSSTDPTPEALNFNTSDGGKDFSFDQSNPYCYTVLVPTYAIVKGSIKYMSSTCNDRRSTSVFPAPKKDAYHILRTGATCLLQANRVPCCTSAAVAASSFSVFIAGMQIQHSIASDVYNNSALCGGGLADNWMKWNSQTMRRNNEGAKATVERDAKIMIAKCKGGTVKVNGVDTQYAANTDCVEFNKGLKSRKYRQWYYGGVERQDNGPNACPDVTKTAEAAILEQDTLYPENIVEYMGGRYPAQKYYMRGTEAGNYACERFNYRRNGVGTDDKAKYEGAYQCCLEKSKSSVCIERKYCSLGVLTPACSSQNLKTEHKFCKAGDKCTIGAGINDVTYAAKYKEDNRMICVNTTSLCPYDFNIGGGSSVCDYFKDGKFVNIHTGSDDRDMANFTRVTVKDLQDKTCTNGKSEIRNDDCSFNEFAGKCKNYCQYLNHCVVVGGNSYIYNTSLTSPYFSNACLNFVGDSQNEYGYGKVEAGETSITGVQQHLTAPIAQCVRETLENVFYNKAGHSKCKDPNEYASKSGECITNIYEYRKGQPLGNESFFATVQSKLKNSIKLVLTISIMMQGFRMLLTGVVLKHDELIMYVTKMGLVLFFATGTAWQTFFFNGVYNVSATFSSIVMNIRVSADDNKVDGCQFGKVTTEDGTSNVVSTYPKGLAYLAIFDAFDCKIARYLGLGPSLATGKLVKMIIPSLFSPKAGAIGAYFAVLTLLFGIFMLIAAFKALYIFLTSAFAIIMLVYVSPITITAALFAKTKGIFDRWLSNLMGFSLQPIILFAYLGIFITVFETLVTGSATFKGKSPNKEIVCDKYCVDQDGTKIAMTECASGNSNNKIIDPESDSVACIMNFKNNKVSSIPVLEPLGVAIPMMIDFFENEGRLKVLTMLKALLVIYILSQFLNDIPGIAKNLMGGERALYSGKTRNPLAEAERLANKLVNFQKRGAGLAIKAASNIRSGVTDMMRGMADRGKKKK